MPDLVLIVMDRHNIENVVAALPAGSVYVGITLTRTEWTADAELVARQVLAPLFETARQRWPEALVA